MRRHPRNARSFVRALGFAAATVFLTATVFVTATLLTATAVLAQEEPALPDAGPPWFFWAGVVMLGMVGLSALALGLGYLVQARGFERTTRR